MPERALRSLRPAAAAWPPFDVIEDGCYTLPAVTEAGEVEMIAVRNGRIVARESAAPDSYLDASLRLAEAFDGSAPAAEAAA